MPNKSTKKMGHHEFSYTLNKNTFLFFKIVLVDLVSDGGVTGDGDGFLLGGELQVGVVTDLGGVYSHHVRTRLRLVQSGYVVTRSFFTQKLKAWSTIRSFIKSFNVQGKLEIFLLNISLINLEIQKLVGFFYCYKT